MVPPRPTGSLRSARAWLAGPLAVVDAREHDRLEVISHEPDAIDNTASCFAALYRLELVCELSCSQYTGAKNPAQLVNTAMRSGPHKLHEPGESPASHRPNCRTTNSHFARIREEKQRLRQEIRNEHLESLSERGRHHGRILWTGTGLLALVVSDQEIWPTSGMGPTPATPAISAVAVDVGVGLLEIVRPSGCEPPSEKDPVKGSEG